MKLPTNLKNFPIVSPGFSSTSVTPEIFGSTILSFLSRFKYELDYDNVCETLRRKRDINTGRFLFANE